MTRNNNKYNNNVKELGQYHQPIGKKQQQKLFRLTKNVAIEPVINSRLHKDVAFFGVKDFKGATRRHNKMLRKILSGYGQDVPSSRPSTRPAPNADPIPCALREKNLSKCNKLAKHRETE
jgi:hypothetical protein